MSEPLKPFITGVPSETLGVPKTPSLIKLENQGGTGTNILVYTCPSNSKVQINFLNVEFFNQVASEQTVSLLINGVEFAKWTLGSLEKREEKIFLENSIYLESSDTVTFETSQADFYAVADIRGIEFFN